MAKFEAKVGVSQWVQLPGNVRTRLAELFNLEANGGAIVQDGKLKQDRHTEKDLEAITVKAMQKLTGSTSTAFFELFDKVLEFVENEQVDNQRKAEEQRELQAEALQQASLKTATEVLGGISEIVKPILKQRRRPKKIKV